MVITHQCCIHTRFKLIKDDISVAIAREILSKITENASPDQIRAIAIDGLKMVEDGKLPMLQAMDGTVPDVDTLVNNQYAMVDKIRLLYNQITTLTDKLINLKNTITKNQSIENISVQSINDYIANLAVTGEDFIVSQSDIETSSNVDITSDFIVLEKVSTQPQVNIELNYSYFLYEGNKIVNDSSIIDTGNPPASVPVVKNRISAVIRMTDDYRITDTVYTGLIIGDAIWSLQKFDRTKYKVGIGLTFRVTPATNVSSIYFDVPMSMFETIEVVSIVKDGRETTHISKMFRNNTKYTIYSEFDSVSASTIKVNLRVTPVNATSDFDGKLLRYGSTNVITDNAWDVT